MALDVPLLRSSLELIVERQPEFTPRFYEILFSRYPQVQPLFGKNSGANQAKMLQEAIVAVLDHVEDATWLTQTLGAMGAKHIDYEVEDSMYPWVGECLLATLAEIAGDDWSQDIERAWAEAYGAISGLMLAGAATARGAQPASAAQSATV